MLAGASGGNFLIMGIDLIKEFLNEIKGELIDYMDTNDRNATGKSKKSIQIANITITSGQIIGADHIQYVFKGRAPGKMPPLFAIIEWCSARGLPRAVAWIIAKRISENGTKLYRQGRNVLNEIITEEKIQDFINKLTAVYTAEIKTEIETLLAAA